MAYKYRLQNTLYKRQWMRDRRANFLADKKCCVCGSTKELKIIWPLINGKRTKMRWSYGIVSLEPILQQAVIYCAEHFKEKQIADRKKPLEHGSLRMYKRHPGCRCRKCTDASTEWSRIYRARKQVEHEKKVEAALKRQGIPRNVFDRLEHL